MKPTATLLLCVFVVLGGCGADGLDDDDVLAVAPQPGGPAPAASPPVVPASPEDPVLPPGAAAEPFRPVVDHPYFPLEAGSVRVYEGTKDGAFRRDEVTVLAQTQAIAGVECTAVSQRVYLDGVLAETTTEWFATDSAGNVWKFGEESLESGVLSEDSWRAGEDGARPWMVFAADPQVGDVYRDDVAGEVLLVTAVGENGVEVTENPDDPDDQDIIIYTAGVGMVSEQSASGVIRLVPAK